MSDNNIEKMDEFIELKESTFGQYDDSKLKQALLVSNNDVDRALKWLLKNDNPANRFDGKKRNRHVIHN